MGGRRNYENIFGILFLLYIFFEHDFSIHQKSFLKLHNNCKNLSYKITFTLSGTEQSESIDKNRSSGKLQAIKMQILKYLRWIWKIEFIAPEIARAFVVFGIFNFLFLCFFQHIRCHIASVFSCREFMACNFIKEILRNICLKVKTNFSWYCCCWQQIGKSSWLT